MTREVKGKHILQGLACLAAAVLALNSYTIVGAGEVKTATYFGKVQSNIYSEGLHVVNPLYDFDTWDTKELPFEMSNVSIPAKDKFKSSADITIMWSIEPGMTTSLRQQIGTQSDVEYKLMRQPLLSLVREAGRSVENAQDLFTEDTQNKLQNFIHEGLSEIVKPYGISISQVYIQDITLPDVINQSIITTKRLEEQKAQEGARLEQQSLIYERGVRESAAKAKSAENNKKAAEQEADGKLYAAKKEADGLYYAASQQAKANKLLGQSVSKELISLKRIDVEMQKAKSWNGTVPTTLMGAGNDGVVPLYHMNKNPN